MREAPVKKAIKEYLTIQENLKKCYFVRNNSFAGFLLDAKGRKHWVQNGKAGSPDFIVCLNGGKWLGIEVKGDGKQTKEQIECEKFIKKLGGIYLLATSVKDVEGVFKCAVKPPKTANTK